MNGDGNKDLIIGNYDGYIYMYPGKADGTLGSSSRLSTASGPIKNNAKWEKGTYPAITDWNNDGLKDMIVAFHHYYNSGDVEKYVTLFLNTGSKTNPIFEDKGNVLADGQKIDFNWFQCPQVIDLNADGKKDLVLGHSGWSGVEQNGTGYLWFYENSGTDAAPTLKAGVKLTLKNGTAIQDAGMKNMNSICITHWDNDGALDMLIVHQNRVDPACGDPIRPTIRILKGDVVTAITTNYFESNTKIPNFSIISTNSAILKNCNGMSLTVFSLYGDRIASYTDNVTFTDSKNIDLTRFVSGTYLYRFENNDKASYTGSFKITR